MALPIGWFSTGRDEAALWLLDETLKAISKGFLPIEIAFVFCNREEGDAPQERRLFGLCEKGRAEIDCFLVAKVFAGTLEKGQIWRRRGVARVEAPLP